VAQEERRFRTSYTPVAFRQLAEVVLADAVVIGRQALCWLLDRDDDLQGDWYRERGWQSGSVSYAMTVELASGDLLRVREVKDPLPLIRVHLFRLRPAASVR